MKNIIVYINGNPDNNDDCINCCKIIKFLESNNIEFKIKTTNQKGVSDYLNKIGIDGFPYTEIDGKIGIFGFDIKTLKKFI